MKFFFRFGQTLFDLARTFAVHHEKALLLRQFFKTVLRLFNAYLIILSLEKEIIVLEKSLEKVLKFGSKNLYEPCHGWIC